MNEPKQPVCKGVDAKGELIWGFVPMARWQQAMFPVRYVGDFIGFWLKRVMHEKTGVDADDIPNMEFKSRYTELKKPRQHHKGD